jgi:hypothetical protein
MAKIERLAVPPDMPRWPRMTGKVVVPRDQLPHTGRARRQYPMFKIIQSRGVLVGDHGKQVNIYTVRLRAPAVSFARVLRHPDVRTALRSLAAKPRDAALRQRAHRSIRHHATGEKRVLRYDLPQAGVRVIRARSGEPGRVDIERSRRIRIGDHAQQINRFTVRAENVKADAGALVRESSAVADALLHLVITGHADRLNRVLRDRLGAEVRRHTDRLSVNVGRPVGPSIKVTRARGVVVGEHHTVSDKFRPMIKGAEAADVVRLPRIGPRKDRAPHRFRRGF